MQAIKTLEQTYKKPAVAQVQSGDTVKVHQVIREGSKKRIQIFNGVVIRTHRMNELTATITVRRIASGVGVEKTFLLHSPNVTKVEILRRAKVRRNFLSYLRDRRGKSARLQEVAFDKTAANVSDAPVAEASEEEIDAEITELPEEDTSVTTEESTEEVVKEENKDAASEDAKSIDDPADQGDEAALPAEEFESGVDKAEPQE